MASPSAPKTIDPCKQLRIALCSSKADVRRDAALVILRDHPDEVGNLAFVQPLPPEVAEFFAEKLQSSNYGEASTALGALTGLPPSLREKWIPRLLDQLDRFKYNSEWEWIIGCLAPYYDRYQEQIDPVLQTGLDDDYGKGAVMDLLPKIGSRANALIPDLLAYIAQQQSFTNEEPHLVHLEPQGTKAIPGLIALLSDPKETVRSQAANELAAYGPIARSAIPVLTELAERLKGIDLVSIQHALKVIQMSASAKSPTQVALEQVNKAIQE